MSQGEADGLGMLGSILTSFGSHRCLWTLRTTSCGLGTSLCCSPGSATKHSGALRTTSVFGIQFGLKGLYYVLRCYSSHSQSVPSLSWTEGGRLRGRLGLLPLPTVAHGYLSILSILVDRVVPVSPTPNISPLFLSFPVSYGRAGINFPTKLDGWSPSAWWVVPHSPASLSRELLCGQGKQRAMSIWRGSWVPCPKSRHGTPWEEAHWRGLQLQQEV